MQLLMRIVLGVLLLYGSSVCLPEPARAGSTAISGELIWPSQNDLFGSGVGGIAGEGKKMLESQWRKITQGMAPKNYVVSGLVLPASDPDLTITVPLGVAFIDGEYVSVPATNVTLPASTTSHLYLKLVFAGGLVTGAEIEDNATGVDPASSVKLGRATTSGTAVTSTDTTERLINRYRPLDLRQLFTASGTFLVPSGVTEVNVEIFGASGGGGGGGGGDGASNVGCNGGAGGQGMTSRSTFTVTPGTSTTITIGAAGTGGAGGGTVAAGSPGGAGGTTSFGASLSQAGGAGGAGGGGNGGPGCTAGANGANATPGGELPIWSGPPGGAGGAGQMGTGSAGAAGTAGKLVVYY